MYNYISGTISELTPSYAVVDNHGIGYLIEISLNTYTQIKDLKVRCHDDAQDSGQAEEDPHACLETAKDRLASSLGGD